MKEPQLIRQQANNMCMQITPEAIGLITLATTESTSIEYQEIRRQA